MSDNDLFDANDQLRDGKAFVDVLERAEGLGHDLEHWTVPDGETPDTVEEIVAFWRCRRCRRGIMLEFERGKPPAFVFIKMMRIEGPNPDPADAMQDFQDLLDRKKTGTGRIVDAWCDGSFVPA